MAQTYKLDYTAADINERLRKVNDMVTTVNKVSPDENGNIEINSHCWKGKKVVFLGDSIAQGYSDKGNISKPYPIIIADNLGMSMTNYGIGGSTVAQQENYGGAFSAQSEFEAAEKDTGKFYQVISGQSYKTYEYDTTTSAWVNSNVMVRTPLSARWNFMRNDADLIIVQGGTNDFQYNWTPVGTMEDRTPDTFYGALHTLFAGLTEKYKKKTIVFLTPIKRSQTPYTTPESKNTNAFTLSEYRDIMLKVCDYYGIPVIDVFSVSGLNPYLESQADVFDASKTHPLQWGHYRLGDIISSRLLYIQQFDNTSSLYDGDDYTSVTWNENLALNASTADYISVMNCRTTTNYVKVPSTGLSVTLVDDDIEMCIYEFSSEKVVSKIMTVYYDGRIYNTSAGCDYIKVMVRSKSNPNGTLITAERATAGVQFTAQ